jgi:hypothetical protein
LVSDDFPYGTGVFMIMCALLVMTSPKTERMDVVYIMLIFARMFVPDEIVCSLLEMVGVEDRVWFIVFVCVGVLCFLRIQ